MLADLIAEVRQPGQERSVSASVQLSTRSGVIWHLIKGSEAGSKQVGRVLSRLRCVLTDTKFMRLSRLGYERVVPAMPGRTDGLSDSL